MSKKPSLKLVNNQRTGNKPCRTLADHGQALWNRIASEYDITDAAGRELLTLACQCLDRPESLRATIDSETFTTSGRFGLSGRRSFPRGDEAAIADGVECMPVN